MILLKEDALKEQKLADVTDKDQGEVTPVYADAIRQMKKTDKMRQEARKLPEAPKTETPKVIKTEPLRKMHLSESLFEYYDEYQEDEYYGNYEDEEKGFAVYTYRLSDLSSLYEYIDDNITFDEFKVKLAEGDEDIIDQLRDNLFSLATEWDEYDSFTTTKKAYSYIKKADNKSDPILYWVIRDMGDEYAQYDEANIEDLLLKNKDKILNFKLNESLVEDYDDEITDVILVMYADGTEVDTFTNDREADAFEDELNAMSEDELSEKDILGYARLMRDDEDKFLESSHYVIDDEHESKLNSEITYYINEFNGGIEESCKPLTEGRKYYSYDEAIWYIESKGFSCDPASELIGDFICNQLDIMEDGFDEDDEPYYLKSTLDSIIEDAKEQQAEWDEEESEDKDSQDYSQSGTEQLTDKQNISVKKDNNLVEAKKDIESAVYDELAKLWDGKDKLGKPKHIEVYANPSANGYRIETVNRSVIDEAEKIAKKYKLPYNSRQVRDYFVFTVDLPEEK